MGVSFILSRKLAAPALAVAAGVTLLASAVLPFVLLMFLDDGGIDLPWRVTRVLMAVMQLGAMAAYTLAAVHYILAAGGSAPRSDDEGKASNRL